MSKHIFSMLFADLHWKLFALLAGSVLWFLGMNMSDPYMNDSFHPRLQLHNIEVLARDGMDGIIVLNEEELREMYVSVIVRGLRSEIRDLSMSRVELGVDFRAIDSHEVIFADGITSQLLRINPNLPAGFEHLSITPPYVEVYLDTADRRSFSVQTVQTGEVMPGFELQQDIHIFPENVTVSGSRTDIRDVSLVLANVDISGVHGDVSQTVQLQVLDRSGDDMTDRVQLNFPETTASVSVWQVRPTDVVVRVIGAPAVGFAVAGIDYELDTVSVVGPEESLAELEYINVEMDLANVRVNTTRTLNLLDWLPEGVYLKMGEMYELNVTARIEPIEERTFIVPRDYVRSRGVGGIYQVLNDDASIHMTLSGPRSVINGLDVTEIGLELDLRTLAIGTHTVSLIVELPDGLTLVGSAPTWLVQIHEPDIPNNDNEEDDWVVSSETPYEFPYYHEDTDEYYGEYDEPQGADDDDYEELMGTDED
ncbi:MAG: CdaR family protein [Defluviitaleaceae bacterium]|nr:CdaR family protein [Defluviitaleaceae bacterium]